MGQDQLNLLTDWVNKYLRRAFTVRSDEKEPTEILSLHKDHLYHMRNEFEESYNGLSTSKPKNANDPLGISTSIQVNENSLALTRSAHKAGKTTNLDDNM